MNSISSSEQTTPMAYKILIPLAKIELVDQGTHFLKIKVVFFGQEQHHWIPLSLLNNRFKLQAYLADQVGYHESDIDSQMKQLQDSLTDLPCILGTSRLGWTPDGKAFVYNGTVYHLDPQDPQQYEFVAPEGTLIKQASRAFTPKGDRDKQFRAFQTLWKESWEFRMVLSRRI